jgi:hypothetical protein
MSERVLLDTAEAAEIVFNGKKSKNAIQRAVRLGQLPAVRIGGRIFFVESELRTWLRDQMAQSLTPSPPAPVDTMGTIRRL